MSICEECLKELKPQDRPYKCFNNGFSHGEKSSQRRIIELESKIDTLTEENNKLKIILANRTLERESEDIE